MSTPEELFGKSIDANRQLKEIVEDKVGEYDASVKKLTTLSTTKMNNMQNDLAVWEKSALKNVSNSIVLLEEKNHKESPITPNFLADTYQFSSLCGGEVNTSMDIIEGHTDSLFGASYRGTPNANVTMEIVTLDKLDARGIDFNGDLALATNNNGSRPFYGSGFRVLLFTANITKDVSSLGSSYIQVLNQGCPQQTGWSKGQITTQSQVLANVVSASGDIYFQPHSNAPATIKLDKKDVGQGWKFHHATRQGFGGCHQPYFRGVGKMTVAIALPYFGYGNNKGNFFWADSIQQAKNGMHRYSHFMGND